MTEVLKSIGYTALGIIGFCLFILTMLRFFEVFLILLLILSFFVSAFVVHHLRLGRSMEEDLKEWWEERNEK